LPQRLFFGRLQDKIFFWRFADVYQGQEVFLTKIGCRPVRLQKPVRSLSLQSILWPEKTPLSHADS
jgi:hypothetical protein